MTSPNDPRNDCNERPSYSNIEQIYTPIRMIKKPLLCVIITSKHGTKQTKTYTQKSSNSSTRAEDREKRRRCRLNDVPGHFINKYTPVPINVDFAISTLSVIV